MINDVFINNEKVMEQFVKDFFLGRVQVKKTYYHSKDFLRLNYFDVIFIILTRILLIPTSKSTKMLIRKIYGYNLSLL